MAKKNPYTIKQWHDQQSKGLHTILWPFIKLGYVFFWLLSRSMAFLAAFSKGLGYAYGTLILLAFFQTFNLAILGSFLTWPYVILGGLIAGSIFLLSLAMEGRKTASNILKLYDHLPERLDQLRIYCDTYFLQARWKIFFKNLAIECLSVSYLLTPGAGIAKGASMAAGTIGMHLALLHLLSLPLTASTLLIVTLFGLIAGVCVGSVSFVGKEGPKFNKHIDGLKAWLRGDSDSNLFTDKPINKGAFLLAISVPLVAAMAKALAYSFGTLTLIAFFTVGPNMYSNSALIFSSAVLTPQYLLLIGALSVSIFFVSLGMEGLYTADKLYRRFTGHALRQSSELEQSNKPKPKKNIQKKLLPAWRDATFKQSLVKTLHAFLDLAQAVSLLGPISKGTSMMSGTLGMLFALGTVLHLSLPFPLIISIAGVLGFAATSVSVGKEWSDDLSCYFLKVKKGVSDFFLSHKDEVGECLEPEEGLFGMSVQEAVSLPSTKQTTYKQLLQGPPPTAAIGKKISCDSLQPEENAGKEYRYSELTCSHEKTSF